jgi:hypothetical protein
MRRGLHQRLRGNSRNCLQGRLSRSARSLFRPVAFWFAFKSGKAMMLIWTPSSSLMTRWEEDSTKLPPSIFVRISISLTHPEEHFGNQPHSLERDWWFVLSIWRIVMRGHPRKGQTRLTQPIAKWSTGAPTLAGQAYKLID